MIIEKLKKYKIFCMIVLIIMIIGSIAYYFGYYKHSPEYAANMFWGTIKNNTPEQRNIDEIYNMIYSEKLHDWEHAVKSYYSVLTIDEYKLKGKQKIDDELYEFTIFVDPKLEDGINTDENNKISNFFMIKVSGKWKVVIGIHTLPDSKFQEHEDLYERLVKHRIAAEKNGIILMGDNGF
ncbi:MAG: hypothetical protein HFE57_04580 [Firmicutes bacterium]|jgi:hypothetical protein|nr:hypothetical protein [Bacillota bacterium]